MRPARPDGGRPRQRIGAGPAVLAAVVLAVSACNTSSGAPEQTPSTSDAPTSVAPSSSPLDTATNKPLPSREDQVAQLWTALHEERLTQIDSDAPPAGGRFVDLVTSEAVELVVTLVDAGRNEVTAQRVDTEFWPTVEIAANGTEATVSDCILVARRPVADPNADVTVRSQVWRGAAEETEDGWRLSDVSPGATDCVPAELNRELFEAYRAYHEAWTAAWDPPDPDHPRLDETMTGDRLEGIRQALEQDRADGVVFRDPHDPSANAVVLELGIGRATVSDCHPAHPGYGAFDAETGERLDDIVAPVTEGQLNLTSVDLVRTTQGWKVTDAGGVDGADCRPRGTPYDVVP